VSAPGPPTIVDRADGQRDDHFAIGRKLDGSARVSCWEWWNAGEWKPAGEIFIGRQAAEQALELARGTA